MSDLLHLPTPGQTLLLRAALGDAATLRTSWEQWAASHDLDDIDGASFRLLPLVYANARAQDVASALPARVKGIYRQSWTRSALLRHTLAGVLRDFQEVELPVVLLKGMPLALRNYPDAASRPMEDADLIVPLERWEEAVQRLEARGWVSDTERWLWNSIHGVSLHHEGRQIDLHRFALPECRWNAANDSLWKRAIPLEVDGVSTLAACATDQLFMVCVHGAKWNPMSPVRWIADAMLLLRTETVDWEYLTARARDEYLSLPLLATLPYLRRQWDVPIPAEVIEELHRAPVAGWQRRERRFLSRAQHFYSGDDFYAHYARYLRVQLCGTPEERSGFLRYMQRIWDQPQRWRVVWRIFRRVGRRGLASLQALATRRGRVQ